VPVPPDQLNSELPAELAAIIRKCLEKDRDLRCQSAGELRADLKRVRRDRSSGESVVSRSAAFPSPSRRRSVLPWGAVAALALTAGGAWLLWGRGPRKPVEPMRILPFTTDGGLKLAPRLSPDGDRVVYAWAGPSDDNWDIYVKATGPGSKPLRLTDHPASDWAPAWSPDGLQIAFVRETPSGGTVYAIPSLGGQERRLTELEEPIWWEWELVPRPSWSPDGAWLALARKPSAEEPSRVFRLSVSTLEISPLTDPPPDSAGDTAPAWSPDGSTLAFVRRASREWGDLHVWVQPVAGGETRRLTSDHYETCGGLAWTPAGDEIVFSTGIERPGRLHRVSLEGGPAQPVTGVGEAVGQASLGENRMVYVQFGRRLDWDIFRLPLDPTAVTSPTPEKLIASSQRDAEPAYSPDGRQVAFQSDRAGGPNIWVSDADGSDAVQLTSFEAHTGSPSWSPDGRRIAFDSREAGSYDIYVVDAAGGIPQRLTYETSDDITPSYSRDGDWIYFASDRSGSGRSEVWKMPAGGGEAVQVTHGGGVAPRESRDGRAVYYFKDPEDGTVWRVPGKGGEETEVLRGAFTGTVWRVPVEGGEEAEVPRGAFTWYTSTLSESGIYFFAAREALRYRRWACALRRYDLHSGEVTEVFSSEVSSFWPCGAWPTVSPDERFLLFAQAGVGESELMLVENFR
jgi:Tol biopolymer transport system component